MGNLTNERNWAARERLRRVELMLWWRGWAGRADLTEGFGISAAQASGDLQRYAELNPGALVYATKRKRYEGTSEMRCILHEPKLEEAVGLFCGGGVPLWEQRPAIDATGDSQQAAADKVDVFRPLVRRASPEVERRVFLAMQQGRRIRVGYASLSKRKPEWREIAPHALGHDGYRWHVRAWCFNHEEFRDFAPSRMNGADWPAGEFTPPVIDVDWETIETVVLVPHSGLSPEQRRAIEVDYGMIHGKISIPIRRAMREYILAHCRVATSNSQQLPRPQHLELAE